MNAEVPSSGDSTSSIQAQSVNGSTAAAPPEVEIVREEDRRAGDSTAGAPPGPADPDAQTLPPPAPPSPRMSRADVQQEAARWLNVVTAEGITPDTIRWVSQETVENFRYYYNRSYIEVRKAANAEMFHYNIEWSGEGSLLFDIEGNEIVDCLGGYGCYSAGMRHPKIVEAVRAQARRMPLSSQELLDPLRGALARLLGELAPGDLQYSFFANNGTDAVDGAMKLARVYTGKNGFISSLSGFHGKSMGALSLMGKSSFRAPFEPLLPEIYFVPFGNANAVEEELWKATSVGKGIAAVVMEPIQGEAGAIVPPDDFWPRLRELCNEYECLLIADEVQTGLGRTGKLFGVDHWNVAPDIMTLGKYLGGGVMPLSAFISTPKIWEIYNDNPLLHTSTFGGNPLACAAGIAAVQVALEEDLPGQAARKGEWLLRELQAVCAEFPNVVHEVRGKGLLIGMQFLTAELGWAACTALYDHQVLVAGTLTNAKTLRFEPALNIPDALLERVVQATRAALTHVVQRHPELLVDRSTILTGTQKTRHRKLPPVKDERG